MHSDFIRSEQLDGIAACDKRHSVAQCAKVRQRQRAAILLLVGVASCSSDTPPYPQVDAVEPNMVPAGQVVACQIHGRNFLTQLRVDVDSKQAPTVRRDFGVWVGPLALPQGLVTRVSATALSIVVPGTLAVGKYEVKVQTPSGRWATKRDALTVFQPTAGAGGVAGGVSVEPNSRSGGGSAGSDASASIARVGGAGAFDASAAGAASYATSSVVTGSGGTTAASGLGGANGGNAFAAGTAGVSGASPSRRPTMWTDGQVLRDACGNRIVVRGVQQILGEQLPRGNDWAGLMDSIASTGANAVRIQVETATLGVTGVDSVLARLATHDMVAIVNPDVTSWLADANVKTMLTKYKDRLILDAYGPAYDDRTKFVTEAKSAVVKLRGYGYDVPLIVLSNAYGRDLPAVLNYGAQIIAADPLGNTFLGWDAYWGSSGWYQKLYGMSLSQGIAASASAAFLIQVGLTLVTDTSSNEYLDYETAMTDADSYGLGWLWWDWYNPYGTQNNLSADGSSANLLAAGVKVVSTHPGGLSHTATRVCNPL